ncbi:unnamed protein product [Rotaria socialis]|uniref:Endonuclease/exonuclease/phosphatase domain-containing protein n=1 Tax=Rotaria socialis TaxID=392032 RepID=A0A821RAC0_9BILA|nr:unnamed protein product [Rotaria socialis]
MTTFHLATINVHHFRHSVTYNINIEELVGIHKPYDLAFVVAQEINSFDNWSKFCNLLGLENIVFGASESDSFGNVQNNIDILMGDMNSLTRDDYSNDYYQINILELREKSEWPKPYFDLTNLVLDQWSYIDAFRQINPDLNDEKVATCQFTIRIDYIYVRPRVNDS